MRLFQTTEPNLVLFSKNETKFHYLTT